MTGYVLSRTVGLPGDSGDVSNWGYPLGTVSLIVEGCFVVLAVICVTRIRRGWQSNYWIADGNHGGVAGSGSKRGRGAFLLDHRPPSSTSGSWSNTSGATRWAQRRELERLADTSRSPRVKSWSAT